ncbi:MAG: M48 family metallopeptidase [Dokdonella sp.]
MNFFEHQELARRQTRRMLLLFALAVAAIVAAIDIVVLFAFGIDSAQRANGGVAWGSLLTISLCVVIAIALGSLYRIASLRGGGAVVARSLGGVPVAGDSGDFAYRRLRNVVDEIAIAAGVPAPQIFVLEDEAGINAFASGYAPTDAAVTVTRGALDKLTRSELQGVIGHEFSHILTGDMRLNIQLMGFVFGIVVVSIIGRKIAEISGRGRGKDSAGPVFFGLAVFAVGYIGVVFARVIKASISRQREFLADASAVQFTRQTDGIAGALKKIGGLAEGSKLASSDTEEVAHMLFGDGVGYAAAFATHPPLRERIKRLDPSFRDDEFVAIAAAWSQPIRLGAEAGDRADASIAGFAPVGAMVEPAHERGMHLPAQNIELNLSPQAVVRQVGNPDSDDRSLAHTIRTGVPPLLREAARQAEQAMALIFALLINSDAATAARQFALIEAHYDSGTRALVQGLADAVAQLHPMQRLPLATLAFPALRRRPRPQLTGFMVMLRGLIDADGRVTLAEYCLARLIGVQVIDALNPAAAQASGRLKLPELAGEVKDLLAIVAQYGHDDAADARRAYALGIDEVLPGSPFAYAPPPDWALALDRALPQLDRLAPAGKELVVRALTRAIAADGRVSVVEAELLRTVCAALHCPLPPLMQEAD